MASADILRAARARIEDPKRLSVGAYATDRRGRSVHPTSGAAACWCAYGALRAEGAEIGGPEADLLEKASLKLFDYISPASVNDKLGHAAVLKMYDTAIAAAEAGAGR